MWFVVSVFVASLTALVGNLQPSGLRTWASLFKGSLSELGWPCLESGVGQIQLLPHWVEKKNEEDYGQGKLKRCLVFDHWLILEISQMLTKKQHFRLFFKNLDNIILYG